MRLSSILQYEDTTTETDVFLSFFFVKYFFQCEYLVIGNVNRHNPGNKLDELWVLYQMVKIRKLDLYVAKWKCKLYTFTINFETNFSNYTNFFLEIVYQGTTNVSSIRHDINIYNIRNVNCETNDEIASMTASQKRIFKKLRKILLPISILTTMHSYPWPFELVQRAMITSIVFDRSFHSGTLIKAWFQNKNTPSGCLTAAFQ